MDHRAYRRFIDASPAVRQDNFAKRIREDKPSNNLRFTRNVETNLQS